MPCRHGVRQGGFWLFELGVGLLVVASFMAVSWLAYDAQARRSRSAQLRDSLFAQVAQLENVFKTEARYPAAAERTAGLAAYDFRFAYETNKAQTAFALVGSSVRYAIWFGFNSSGLRCVGGEGGVPVGFSYTDHACPAGTRAF